MFPYSLIGEIDFGECIKNQFLFSLPFMKIVTTITLLRSNNRHDMIILCTMLLIRCRFPSQSYFTQRQRLFIVHWIKFSFQISFDEEEKTITTHWACHLNRSQKAVWMYDSITIYWITLNFRETRIVFKLKLFSKIWWKKVIIKSNIIRFLPSKRRRWKRITS